MTPALRVSLTREFRALLPLWLACVLLALAPALTEHDLVRSAAGLAYVLGSFAIGAHAFGHEYAHRTLPQLLALPVSRYQTLFVKLVVAGVLVTLLGGAAALTVLGELDNGPATPPQIVLVVWLTAMLLAPAFTLLCRGTLAGAIFAGSLLGCTALGGDIIGWIRYDTNHAAIQRFQILFFWRVMPLLWFAAAVALWRSFVGAEATEGRGREIHFPQWLAPRRDGQRAARRQTNPLWQLVAKELRLQQMVFAIGAIYLTIALFVVLRARMDPHFDGEILLPVTAMYAALLGLLAGALAGAEERQLGTIQWQLLLPMPVAQQWGIKAAVAYAVSVGLAVALPTAVILLLPDARVEPRHGVTLLAVVLVLATASLYISSLASSGIRALVLCVPVVAGGIPLVSWITVLVERAIRTFARNAGWHVGSTPTDALVLTSALLFTAGFAALAIRFGTSNYRRGDRSLMRIAGQVTCIFAYALVAVTFGTFLVLRP